MKEFFDEHCHKFSNIKIGDEQNLEFRALYRSFSDLPILPFLDTRFRHQEYEHQIDRTIQAFLEEVI